MHCSGVQAITRSTRGRSAGSVWRPGCLRLFFFSGVDGSASRSLSAVTSTLLTPGSNSNNSSCRLLSFSPPGPYLAISERNKFRSGWQRIAVALGGRFNVAHARLELQQLQLQIA